MAYKKPKNVFESFARWHPVFNQCKTTLATIDDKFDSERHRPAALSVLVDSSEENGLDFTEGQKSEFMQTASEDTVKEHVDAGFTLYGRRLDTVINEGFDELWESTPDGAKNDLYSLITSFKPKSDIPELSELFGKALKEHKYLAKINEKLVEYQNRNLPESRRHELEQEFVEMYSEEIDKAYLDTPKKKEENEKLANAMKKWAEKSPNKMLVRRLLEKQEKAKEKFEKLIKLKDEEDKPSNFKEYMRSVLDTDAQRSLYGTASLYYEHTQREKKSADASDYKMV